MSVPRLLISVRNADEARIAVESGADIVDLKDPDQGSLGMASPATMQSFCTTMTEYPDVPTSAALGELFSDSPAETESCAAIQNLSSLSNSRILRMPDFVKIGLSRSRDQADWREQWQAVRDAVPRSENQQLGRGIKGLQWIAVIYADGERARSVEWKQILDAAKELKCRGVLVDTFGKESGRLTDQWQPSQLEFCREYTLSNQLLFAVAGRLRAEDIPQVAEFSPDIIAVRSAVCEMDNRKSSLSAQRIRDLKKIVRGS